MSKNPWVVCIVGGIIVAIIGCIIQPLIGRLLYNGGLGRFVMLAGAKFVAYIDSFSSGVRSGGNRGFDLPVFLLGLICLVGSILGPWHKVASVSVLMSVALSCVGLGYFRTEVPLFVFSMLCVISAILVVLREPSIEHYCQNNPG